MSIPGFAMRNYRFILVLSVAGILLGIVGFLQMPRQEDPNMSAYWNTVTAIYPGATAEEVEDRVVEPLEEAADELEEIRELRSVSLEGVGVLQVEFREDVDVEEANRLLVERITSKRSELPDGVLDVKVEQRKPSNVVMLEVAVHGMTSDSLLQEWAEELADRLRLLDDSKAVDTYGRREQEVAVLIDPARIGEMGLSLSGIARRVSAAGGEIPGGVVHAGDRRLSIRPSERLASLEDVRNIVISTVDGRPVRLRDVATVDWTTTEARHRVRYDGESAVLVTVSLKEGRNVFHLAEQARRTLASFQGDLPSDVSATVVLDQSRDVKDRLHNFWRNLLQGGAIISIFVAIIVGWRSALVVISAMLLSVTVSFGLMQAWGIVLQQMSIAGLVVVLGLLVDNAIVVVEAIARERRSGLDAIRAAVTGTERVAAAVASSTATTVAAFVPMMRTAGSVGEFTRDIPRVVSLVLVVSLAVAVCMTPLVAARLFRTERSVRSFGMSDWIERNITQRGYRRLIGQAVERPVRVIALVLLGAVALIALFPVLGMSFFPAAEKPVFLVELSTPQGTSFESTEAQAVKVSSYLRSELGVLAVTSNIGDGNPVMYYNHLPAPSASHRAELVVTIDRERVREIPELARRIRGRFADDPDVVVEPKILVQGPPIGLPVSIEIMGEDLERLRAHADRLEAALREIPGAVNVTHDLRPGPPQLELRVDPVKAAQLGLAPADVATEIRGAIQGIPAATLRVGSEDHDIVLRVARERNERIDDLDRLRFPVPGGSPVPLSQLTQPELRSTYAEIHHADLKRSVIVGSDVDGRLARDVVRDLQPAIAALDLNPRESVRIIGEDEERDRAFLSMLQNVIVALALIYGILVLQFRSFKLPLVIFTSIPVALAGSTVGLLVGGWPFGFTAFIGLLALVGIVVNNAIVLIDQVNYLREQGAGLRDALTEGATARLQPIFLTTLTTVAGLLPLTLSHDSMWGPMGWVLIGGLICSTAVTLILVPALYYLLERRSEEARIGFETSAPEDLRKTSVAPGRGHTAGPVTAGLVLLAASLLGAPILGGNAQAAQSDPLRIGLAEALERATVANPALQAQRSNLVAKDAAITSARAALWPSLRVSGEWAVTDDPSETFGISLLQSGGAGPLDLEESAQVLRGSVDLQWLWWDFGRGARIRASQRARDAAAGNLDAAERGLRLDVTQVYFGIVSLQQELAALEGARTLVTQEAEDARSRADTGRGLEADALGLDARQAAIDAQIASTRGRLRQAEAGLAAFLGYEADTRIRVIDDAHVSTPSIDDLRDLVDAARAARPELRSVHAQDAGARAAVSVAHSLRLPRVVAQASYGSFVPERDFDLANNSYRASIGVQWDLFQGGGIFAASQSAQAQARSAEHAVAAATREVERSAVEAWTHQETAGAQLAAAEAQDRAASEAYRIVSLRFREGRDDLSRYLEAEQAQTEARTAVARARAALEISRAEVAWAAGVTTW